jgi:release factor glutamine methyltransferase
MTPNELIKRGSNFLKQNNIKTYLIDSELIFSSVSGQKREKFLLDPNFELNSKQIRLYNNLISRRALAREPIAYLLKNKEFWSIKFNVDKDVLIPRPETEILVEELVKHFKNCKPLILDIGTGSGCIIISLLQELKKSQGIAIDISNKALSMAKRNSKINNTFGRIKFINTSISKFNHFKFDLIVSNPPYIARHQLKNLDEDIKKFEPKIALDGGNDGLDVIRKVIYKSRKILKNNGMLALEIGNGQYYKVSQILKLNKFRVKFVTNDYKNNIRCIFSILNHY